MKTTIKHLFLSLAMGMMLLNTGGAGWTEPSDNALKTSLKRYSVLEYKEKKVLCEPYTVSRDEWLYKIFRKKGAIAEDDFPLFLEIFKQVNHQISNIDTIQPGQQILIPLKTIDKDDYREVAPGVVDVPVLQLTRLNEKIRPFLKKQIVRKGDNVSKLIDPLFLNRDGTLSPEGLRAFKMANPGIKDPNLIYTGSSINIPSPSLLSQPWFASLFPGEEPAKAGRGKKQKKPEKLLPLNQNTRTALTRYASDRNGTMLFEGKFHFPSVNNGPETVLDLSATPLARLKNGGRLLFLPRAVEETTGDLLFAIAEHWNNVETIPIETITKTRSTMEPDDQAILLPKNNGEALAELLKITGFGYTPDFNISFSIGSIELDSVVGKIETKGKKDLLVNFGTVYGKLAGDAIQKKGLT
ncbi:MAG: LysM peptidoglycan-binding domain-containing protein [Desulfobacteraceae bacterium]